MPINFYSVEREALTMPVNCKVDLSYSRNITRSRSTVQQSEGKLFPLYGFPRCASGRIESPGAQDYTYSTWTSFEWFSLLVL